MGFEKDTVESWGVTGSAQELVFVGIVVILSVSRVNLSPWYFCKRPEGTVSAWMSLVSSCPAQGWHQQASRGREVIDT